jgi:hypothetical protein
MKKSRLLGAACACLLFTSNITCAALVEVDLLSPGDGLITRDTETELDWLDATSWDQRRQSAFVMLWHK